MRQHKRGAYADQRDFQLAVFEYVNIRNLQYRRRNGNQPAADRNGGGSVPHIFKYSRAQRKVQEQPQRGQYQSRKAKFVFTYFFHN